MTSHLIVTPAQVIAAQLQLELAEELGETVSPLVRAIAGATHEPVVRNGAVAVVRSDSRAASLNGGVQDWARANGAAATAEGRVPPDVPDISTVGHLGESERVTER
jgi:hypothetical protein